MLSEGTGLLMNLEIGLPLMVMRSQGGRLLSEQGVFPVLIDYLWVFLVALAISVVATPLFAQMASALGVVDRPSARKLHKAPTPYLGGLAMLAAWLVAVVLGSLAFLDEPGQKGPIVGIVIGGLVEDEITESISKGPLVGDIPVLGNLFKSKSKEKSKTELLIFLTPHVAMVDEELDAISQAETDRNTLTQEGMGAELFDRHMEGMKGGKKPNKK